MKNILLKLTYDGTNYCGWQIQPNGVTIEEMLNRHLSDLLQEPIKVIGASRTDSGVHALGNVAVFDTNARMPAEKISYAMNTRLPADIRIIDSEEVAPDFHPRKCHTVKTYEYCIYNRRFPDPTKRLYSYFTYYKLDIEAMRKAASYLVGTHDFKSLSTWKEEVPDTVRTIYSIDITKEEHLIRIRIRGNGFLYNMVRIIAGTLMQAGQGIIQPQDMEKILEAKDRNAGGPTARPEGLTLVSIEYPDEKQQETLSFQEK